ncbi:MAG: zinc-binding dehydrogenase [Planctomycetota bacterium]|nr:zinc-binding dehydrogenase [Planctomycetota bacterium]
MKAAVIVRHGGAECIEVREIDTPAPGPGEVLLAVRAAALNHLDVWVRQGGRASLPMPWVGGSDAAGVVAAVGHGVTGWKEGDEVVLSGGLDRLDPAPARRGEHRRITGIVGANRPGTFAQFAAVPAWTLHRKPAHLDWPGAAALGLDHVTAWRMLFSRADLGPGETVLIHGIGGGLALAALQLAVAGGARAIVTSSSDEKLARAAALGAAVGINYKTADVAAGVLAATEGLGADVVCDSVGAATWGINFAATRPGGRIVHCGVTTGPDAHVNLRDLYWKQLTVMGSAMGSQEEFADMLRAVSAASLSPVLDSTWPLEQARQAAEHLESGKQFGKIVLTVSE